MLQRNGAIMSSAAATRNAYVTPRARGRGFTASAPSVPLLADPELEVAQDREEDHEDVGDGRGPAKVEPVEPVHQVEDDRPGRLDRPAVRHHEDLVVGLEAADDPDHVDEQDRGAQAGQGHPAELRPAAGPVDRRRLVVVARDRLERSQEDDRLEPEALPDRGDHDRGERRRRVREPVDAGQPEEAEHGVDDPGVAVEELPDGRHDHQRGHGREEERGPEEPAQAQRAIEQQRGAKPQRRADPHPQDHEGDRILERLLEARVAQDVEVVLEPDELGRLDPVVVGQAPVGGDDHRDDEEKDGRRQGGCDQQVARRCPAEAAPPRHPAVSSGDANRDHFASAASVWDAASSSAAFAVALPSSADWSDSVMNVSISDHAPTYGKWLEVAIVSRKTLNGLWPQKYGSAFVSSGLSSAAVVAGAAPAYVKTPTCCSGRSMYWMKSQAASLCFAWTGIPRPVPPR